MGMGQDLDLVRMVKMRGGFVRYPIVLNLTLAAGLNVLCGCSSGDAPVISTAKAANPVPSVSSTSAVAVSPANYYETSGVLVVENQVDVLNQRDGMVAEILVDTGTRVEKGQLLARIDDRQRVTDRG